MLLPVCVLPERLKHCRNWCCISNYVFMFLGVLRCCKGRVNGLLFKNSDYLHCKAFCILSALFFIFALGKKEGHNQRKSSESFKQRFYIYEIYVHFFSKNSLPFSSNVSNCFESKQEIKLICISCSLVH